MVNRDLRIPTMVKDNLLAFSVALLFFSLSPKEKVVLPTPLVTIFSFRTITVIDINTIERVTIKLLILFYFYYSFYDKHRLGFHVGHFENLFMKPADICKKTISESLKLL